MLDFSIFGRKITDMETINNMEILKSVSKYCKPLITLCLQNGITAKDFVEAIKSSFVDIASEEFGIRRRKANLSRVSIMTGLSRKEVKRLRRGEMPQKADKFRSASPISRVLAAWYNDPAYLDARGKPKALPYAGKHESFATLAKKYVGDIPISAILRELEKNKLIIENQKGQIEPLGQSFVREGTDGEAVQRMGEVVNELASTICKNFESTDEKFFERRLLTGNISKKDVLAFHKLVREQGCSFLNFLEAWLFERGISDIDEDRNGGYRAGVGIFFFEETDSSGD